VFFDPALQGNLQYNIFWHFDKNFIDIFSVIFDDSDLITVFLKKRDKIFNEIFRGR